MSRAFIKNGPRIERKITTSISDAAVLREICMRQRQARHQENRVNVQIDPDSTSLAIPVAIQKIDPIWVPLVAYSIESLQP